jgi:hypothetical protein
VTADPRAAALQAYQLIIDVLRSVLRALKELPYAVDGDVNNNAAALFAFADEGISLVEGGLLQAADAAQARGGEAAAALSVSSEALAAAAGALAAVGVCVGASAAVHCSDRQRGPTCLPAGRCAPAPTPTPPSTDDLGQQLAQQVSGVAPGLTQLLEQGAARASSTLQGLRAAGLDAESVYAKAQDRSQVGVSWVRQLAAERCTCILGCCCPRLCHGSGSLAPAPQVLTGEFDRAVAAVSDTLRRAAAAAAETLQSLQVRGARAAWAGMRGAF